MRSSVYMALEKSLKIDFKKLQLFLKIIQKISIYTLIALNPIFDKRYTYECHDLKKILY